MTQIVSQFKELITQLHHMLPKNTATAQAIDQHDVSERVAMAAIDYGYVETAHAFVRSVEACFRRGA